MGFFDSLKKIANAAEKAAQQVSTASPKPAAQSASKPTAAKPENKTPQSVTDSGNTPAKQSVLRKSTCYGGENSDEYEISFMLSGDFVEFDSHSELYPSYQYEPDCDDDYTGYKANLPHIVIGPDDQVYEAVEKYLESGKESGRGFKKSDSEYFLFRAKFDYHGGILYAYAFSDKSVKHEGYEMLGLILYNTDVEGTPLERKLLAALDEAAASYTETKVE